MSKTPQLENVHVDIHGGDNFAAGFTLNGYRYHVWFDPEDFEINAGYMTKHHFPVLYKNPPEGKRQVGERTVKLNATAKVNKPLIDEMFRQVREGDMVAKARQHEAEKENRRLAEAAEEARINRIKEAGPQLFEALREICEFWAYGLAKPDGTNPSEEDKANVERIALKALHTLHAADPSYVHTLPASGDR